MKTSDLIGHALDWVVALCECGEAWRNEDVDPHFYSTDWAIGGPIIEREGIDVLHARQDDLSVEWEATLDGETFECGPTLLVAAMRCYVASRLGDEVDIPLEFL